MDGNRQVSAADVTDEQMRAAITRAAAQAAETKAAGFTTLQVAGDLSRGTVGMRGSIWRQVHEQMSAMVRTGELALAEDDFIVLPYYTLAGSAAAAS